MKHDWMQISNSLKEFKNSMRQLQPDPITHMAIAPPEVVYALNKLFPIL